MFQRLFERSADAIFLFDPGREVFVDCNCAAVEMMRATSKQQLLMVHPANLSSEFQPDGQTSREKTPQVINLALSKGSHRFEWRARRMDGTEFPLEVLLTPIQTGEHPLMATVCRDITDRKHAEREILELNASLEQRVAERTAALTTSEARFRALVMAAMLAILGLLPMALSHAVGSETQRPFAVVIIGGMVTTLLVALTVLPVFYQLITRKRLGMPAQDDQP